MALEVAETTQELLDYTLELAKLSQKPYFKLSEYEKYWLEEEFTNKPGIVLELIEEQDGPIWLKIPRLKRIPPPEISELIDDWVTIKNDPTVAPAIEESIVRSVSANEARRLLDEGLVKESDILEPISSEDKASQKRDVIYRLENNEEVKKEIDYYIDNSWSKWSSSEIPRRETIALYDQLFSLQQTLELQSDEIPIEFVFGIGVARWTYEGRYEINHPIIEQQIEIEVDSESGALIIRPRDASAHLAIDPYTVLKIEGTELLRKFYKDQIKTLIDENKEISPYELNTFEPILRTAVLRLSDVGSEGIYWPDERSDNKDRKLPPITEQLTISDSWVLYLRKNRPIAFSDDIRRFRTQLEEPNSNNKEQEARECDESPVKKIKRSAPTARIVSKPSDKPRIPTRPAIAGNDLSRESNWENKKEQDTELLFPKEYNEAQISIIKELQKHDGVVVQGPPGTGKTHTIANIICHYLASGKNVLVTSHGVPALDVLREQIPEELRDLTISLLANERTGFKQLEVAVSMLSNIVTQTNVSELRKETEILKQKINKIKSDIVRIDNQIIDIGKKQLGPISQDLGIDEREINATELTELVNQDLGKHQWLEDNIPYQNRPLFSEQEIDTVRKIRIGIKGDLIYVNKKIPKTKNMLAVSELAAIHEDLVKSEQLRNEIQANSYPTISEITDDRIGLAKTLCKDLEKHLQYLQDCTAHKWLKALMKHQESDKEDVLKGIFRDLNNLAKERLDFLKTPVAIPELGKYEEHYVTAIDRLIDNKKATSILNFKSKKIKSLLDCTLVKGQSPVIVEEWIHVKSYRAFYYKLKQFISVWNNAASEFGFPKQKYYFGEYPVDLDVINKSIINSKHVAKHIWPKIEINLHDLFPYGVSQSEIKESVESTNHMLHCLKTNIAHYELSKRRSLISKQMANFRDTSGPVSELIKTLLKNQVGNPCIKTSSLTSLWEELTSEVTRLSKYQKYFDYLIVVADKVKRSGAFKWSESLLINPTDGRTDPHLPMKWVEAWLWKRRFNYINAIESGQLLEKLSSDRENLDQALKSSVRERIKLLTHIGLHQTMTDRVKGALFKVMSALAKVGRGTGKGAPAHRKDASNAMKECYEGVPCWIMPGWRISETLPSTFGSFDLVIIDEASQSDVTILPAILRAKKLLIVGDDKQVSPDAAFIKIEQQQQLRSFIRNQPFGQLLLPGNSIYDLARSAFPSQLIMLREHFRCVEPIITFSKRFYAEELIPLRYPKKSERINPPLVDIYVPGGARDGLRNINEMEADAIVEEIKVITSDEKNSERTIGVVSLTGKHQAHHIQENLLYEVGEEVYLKHNMACGDSATFQGKEKDIMFLSMVVDPSRFAALTTRSYEQRFNVALSRARDRMYLVRSITENELTNQEDLRLQTIMYFKNPMPARDFEDDDPIALCQSEFERDLYKRLIGLSYQVTPQLKVGPYSIDLVVEGESDSRLAIELDGDRYHTVDKWADDFRRQRTMERMGWTFWRCWGSSYALDPDKCIVNLIDKLEHMDIKPISNNEYVSHKYTEYREFVPKNKDIGNLGKLEALQ